MSPMFFMSSIPPMSSASSTFSALVSNSSLKVDVRTLMGVIVIILLFLVFRAVLFPSNSSKNKENEESKSNNNNNNNNSNSNNIPPINDDYINYSFNTSKASGRYDKMNDVLILNGEIYKIVLNGQVIYPWE